MEKVDDVWRLFRNRDASNYNIPTIRAFKLRHAQSTELVRRLRCAGAILPLEIEGSCTATM